MHRPLCVLTLALALPAQNPPAQNAPAQSAPRPAETSPAGATKKAVPTAAEVGGAATDASASEDPVTLSPFEVRSEGDQGYLGRPADIVLAKDGSMLVADDWAGAIYRISYSKK